MIKNAIIDTREPAWVQSLVFPGAAVVASPLEFGDAMLHCADGAILMIERKEPMDLLGSISDGRLFSQVAGMVRQSPWAYVVVTGEFRRGSGTGKVHVGLRETGWAFPSLQGALLTVQELGGKILYCRDGADYGPALRRLARRDRGAKAVGGIRRSKVLGPGEQAILALSRHIGLERLGAVLKYTGSPGAAIDFLTDLHFEGSIKGIAKGVKLDVRRNLGLGDGERLGLVSEDSSHE